MGRPRKPLRSFGSPWVRIPLLPPSGPSLSTDAHWCRDRPSPERPHHQNRHHQYTWPPRKPIRKMTYVRNVLAHRSAARARTAPRPNWHGEGEVDPREIPHHVCPRSARVPRPDVLVDIVEPPDEQQDEHRRCQRSQRDTERNQRRPKARASSDRSADPCDKVEVEPLARRRVRPPATRLPALLCPRLRCRADRTLGSPRARGRGSVIGVGSWSIGSRTVVMGPLSLIGRVGGSCDRLDTCEGAGASSPVLGQAIPVGDPLPVALRPRVRTLRWAVSSIDRGPGLTQQGTTELSVWPPSSVATLDVSAARFPGPFWTHHGEFELMEILDNRSEERPCMRTPPGV